MAGAYSSGIDVNILGRSIPIENRLGQHDRDLMGRDAPFVLVGRRDVAELAY